jgi:pyruvate-ferredoxin/flavodoxin oxidoreductase
VSHLRFGPKPIESTYLIRRADFIACHQFEFMEKLDVLELARPGATFLLNSPYGAGRGVGKLPREAQQTIVERKLKFYVVDALTVAKHAGLAGRINTVTQACFFAISGILPRDEAIAKIKDSIRKTYGKRGETVLRATSRRSMPRWQPWPRSRCRSAPTRCCRAGRSCRRPRPISCSA